MSRKTNAAYAATIETMLKNLVPDLHPGVIISDFESAISKNMTNIFPDARIQGCYFHLCQVNKKNIYLLYYNTFIYLTLISILPPSVFESSLGSAELNFDYVLRFTQQRRLRKGDV